MRASPDRKVSMAEFARHRLSHKASSRISELNARGWDIRHRKGANWWESYYELVVDCEKSGQLLIA